MSLFPLLQVGIEAAIAADVDDDEAAAAAAVAATANVFVVRGVTASNAFLSMAATAASAS